MESKVTLPRSLCRDELIRYIARRYGCSPEEVIECFMAQEGVIKFPDGRRPKDIRLENNEMEIFRDIGLRPCRIVFTDS